MNLGKRIERERKKLGWTQAHLCSMVPGLQQQTLDRLEKRDSESSRYAVQIAKALGVSLEQLFAQGATATSATAQEPAAGYGAPSSLALPPAPPPNFADTLPAGVSPTAWALLQDLDALPEDEQAAIRRDVHARAERYRAYAAEVLRKSILNRTKR